jgi:DNA-directed RNA polymerase specialized sigma24 family protein
MEELPNPAVCEQLQISESNLWVMLHRARKQLRDELSDWGSSTNRQNQSRILN